MHIEGFAVAARTAAAKPVSFKNTCPVENAGHTAIYSGPNSMIEAKQTGEAVSFAAS